MSHFPKGKTVLLESNMVNSLLRTYFLNILLQNITDTQRVLTLTGINKVAHNPPVATIIALLQQDLGISLTMSILPTCFKGALIRALSIIRVLLMSYTVGACLLMGPNSYGPTVFTW